MNKKKKGTIIALSSVFMLSSYGNVNAQEVVNPTNVMVQDLNSIVEIPDTHLKAALNRELGQAIDSNITVQQMRTIENLDASAEEITNLEGLQYAVNVKMINLRGNKISDIHQLNSLTNVTSLDLGNNDITDIHDLSSLYQLEKLSLDTNDIQDVDSLKYLMNLRYLNLDNNQISDISSLSRLSNLEDLLSLNNNSIADLSPVRGFKNLKNLYASNNNIENIDILSNLSSLENVRLNNNSISDISSLKNIPLHSLEVTGQTIQVVSTTLSNCHVVNKNGEQILIPLNEVETNNGYTRYTGIWNESSTVSGNVAYSGNIQQDVYADATNTDFVNIPDPNLKTVINEELGQENNAEITIEQMESLDRLVANNRNITNLEGIQYATNITYLMLNDNSITDISLLSGLSNLRYLGLDDNSITDLSPLDGLSLSILSVENQQI